MDPKIQRIEPEAAIQSGAVRHVGPRRRPDSEEEGDFSEELAKEAGISGSEASDAAPPKAEQRAVSPPEEGEAGFQIDVVG